MLRLSKGMICLFFGVVTIEASANEIGKVYPQAQEVVIPGYTAPAASSPSTLSAGPQLNNTNSPTMPRTPSGPPPTPEEMHKSCAKFVAPTVPFEAIQDNFKRGFEETATGNRYQWIREGEPNLEITFLDDNTPTAVTGNLPSNIPNAKDLHFSLSDMQRALGSPGKIIGHVHVLSQTRGDGKITIYTDSKNIVTNFSTNFLCH